jgi:hypothetical protein
VNTGAWFLGGYRKGLAGTLGESLDLATTDNLGWALRSWKYELAYNGFRGQMVLDLPALGGDADHQIRAFQDYAGLTADGIIGPKTGSALLQKRIRATSYVYGIPFFLLNGIIRYESSYDLGAIGSVDNADRGPTQQHIYPSGAVNLSQAIRPAWAFPHLGSTLLRIRGLTDLDSAVVSWNVGEGGAEWWFQHDKPTSGSPSWWTAGDLSARATAYLDAVRSGV